MFVIFLFISCSGQSKAPILPDDDKSNVAEGSLQDLPAAQTAFGIYNIEIASDLTDVRIEPVVNRKSNLGEQFLGDITGFLTNIYCQDCAKIDGISLTEEGYINLSISIKHPFNLPDDAPASAKNRLDLHLFDVHGLLFTKDGIYFPKFDIRANPGFLVNADGYSGTFDGIIDSLIYTENDHHPFKVMFEDSSRGNFNPSSYTGGFSNLYYPEGMNVFPQGSDYRATDFILNVPSGRSVQFYLVLTASYGVSAKWGIDEGESGHRLSPRYFLPAFNRQEPWKVDVHIPDFLNFLTEGDDTQTAEIRIDVWDWQDGKSPNQYWDFFYSQAGEILISSNIDRVVLYIPDLLLDLKVIERDQGIGLLPRRFTAQVTNEKQMPQGRYGGLVAAIDELDGVYNLLGFERDGVTPFMYDKIRTYQFFEIDVKHTTTTRPESPVDITPDGLNGCFNDIVVQNNIAYAAVGVLGVKIFDISTPSNPSFLSSVRTDGYATRLLIDDNSPRLYVADKDEGLAVINIQNPHAPFIEGKFDISGSNNAIAVTLYDDYIYLGDANSGLAVIDVSDPTNPSFVRAYVQYPKVRAFAVKEHYLFKLAADAGIEILNIADPENPQHVSMLSISGEHKDISVNGDRGVVLLKDRLVTVDMSNPAQPVLKGSINIQPDGKKVHLIGYHAYVANGEFGVTLISIENLAQPAILNNFNDIENAEDCHYYYGNVFVADSGGELIILGEAGNELVRLGGYVTVGATTGIGLHDRHVFAASGLTGIKSVNIEIPENAYMESTVRSKSFAHDCATRDYAVYVADDKEGVALIDASNPNDIIYVGNVRFPEWGNWIVKGIESSGSCVAIWGDQSNPMYPELILIDAQDRFAPVKTSDMRLSNSIHDIHFGDGYIFAAAGSGGIVTINVSDPSDLSDVGTYINHHSAYAVAYDNNYVYAMFQNLGLEVLDAAEPTNLQKIGSVTTTGLARDIKVAGNYVYTNNNQGMLVFDVSDPTTPVFVSSLRLPSKVHEIIIRGNYAYIALDDAGLRIVSLW